MKFIAIFLSILINFCFSMIIVGADLKEGVLRTPDSRFDNLQDYSFEPNYMIIDGFCLLYTSPSPRDS